MNYPAYVDDVRRSRGLLTIEELHRLVDRGNIIFDPFSVLIAATATIGAGNVLYPCVSLLCHDRGELRIGDNNVFHSNSLVEAASGPIVIGSSNQFGEGGFTAKTNRAGARLMIGDNGRYLNGAAVFGVASLGSGSQILGAITVDSCTLDGGASYMDPDHDRRAGVLKGSGVASNLKVPTGHVILGNSRFSASDIKPQSFFHPEKQ
jgi:hypothetical protein